MIGIAFLRCETIAIESAIINSTIEQVKPCNISNPLIHGLGTDAPSNNALNLVQDFKNIYKHNNVRSYSSMGDYFVMYI